MEPEIFDTIRACVYGVPCLLFLLACLLPINWNFNPKGDDPYRYCPKEEEE
jgi:hypothetical protein